MRCCAATRWRWRRWPGTTRTAAVEGARRGYRTCRRELAELVPPHAADQVLAAYRREGFRLAATAKGVELVGSALRGETFPPRL